MIIVLVVTGIVLYIDSNNVFDVFGMIHQHADWLQSYLQRNDWTSFPLKNLEWAIFGAYVGFTAKIIETIFFDDEQERDKQS